jgi:hypothetical protein
MIASRMFRECSTLALFKLQPTLGPQLQSTFDDSRNFDGKKRIGRRRVRNRQHRHHLVARLVGSGENNGAWPVFYAFFLPPGVL